MPPISKATAEDKAHVRHADWTVDENMVDPSIRKIGAGMIDGLLLASCLQHRAK
jgi:hypothetical protein